jgi:hypothetical protein
MPTRTLEQTIAASVDAGSCYRREHRRSTASVPPDQLAAPRGFPFPRKAGKVVPQPGRHVGTRKEVDAGDWKPNPIVPAARVVVIEASPERS